ncbi:DUF3800 domain-containing protein [Pantoea agglomerans]|uniref:DUF3800 domain-containing protein n=1 Tax=Enterobacter agglomerans TaxID=549 RepID=UPI0016545276|nr:DUF3800 domain-containing protein [Pantoea agglomerans]
MKFYIDESGNFSHENSSWSSVGILAIPEQKEDEVFEFVTKLKIKVGLKENDELKNYFRKDFELKFLDELSNFLLEKKCIFHMSSINSRNISTTLVNITKSKLINSIKKSTGNEKQKTDIIERINLLSTQNFNQCFIHIFSLRNAIEKSISFYAKELPSALSEFSFTFDRKEINKEVMYDKVFSELYLPLLRLDNLLRPYLILNYDISNFKRYMKKLNEEEIKKTLSESETEFNVKSPITNIEYVNPFDIYSVFNNYTTISSNESIGIQLVDVLTSNFNRALKRNFDDPNLIAKSLGRLTINSYIKDMHPIELIHHNINPKLSVDEINLFDIVENESHKLFGFKKDLKKIYFGI